MLFNTVQKGEATAERQEGKGQFTPASKLHSEGTICYPSYWKGFLKREMSLRAQGKKPEEMN